MVKATTKTTAKKGGTKTAAKKTPAPKATAAKAAPKTTPPVAAVKASEPMNYALLMEIMGATNHAPYYMMVSPMDALPLEAAGLVELNRATIDPSTGAIATRITDLGRQACADAPADEPQAQAAPAAAPGWGAPSPAPGFGTPAGMPGAPQGFNPPGNVPPSAPYPGPTFPPPGGQTFGSTGFAPGPQAVGTADDDDDDDDGESYEIDTSIIFTKPTRTRSGSRASKYKFDDMPVNATIFIPFTSDDPEEQEKQLRTVQQACSLANRKYAVQRRDPTSGQPVFRTVTENGQAVSKPVMDKTRGFSARFADGTDPKGPGIRAGRYL